jgi:acetoin utilization deacetylase AcuC-like enzyme
MTIIFHEDFMNSNYAPDTATKEGRMESVMSLLLKQRDHSFIKPEAAEIKDVLRAHSEGHVNNIKKDEKIFPMALLAAGGAIKAAEIAFNGEPAFACIRPPGHHASPTSCWGFCYFNNMGIALLKLKSEGKIKGAFVLDFDAHKGNENINVLSDYPKIKILNPFSGDRESYLSEIKEFLSNIGEIDIIAVSAGFDSYEKEVGNKLKTIDFYLIGKMIKKFSNKLCDGRRFAILEGGYHPKYLGKNVLAFYQGFE